MPNASIPLQTAPLHTTKLQHNTRLQRFSIRIGKANHATTTTSTNRRSRAFGLTGRHSYPRSSGVVAVRGVEDFRRAPSKGCHGSKCKMSCLAVFAGTKHLLESHLPLRGNVSSMFVPGNGNTYIFPTLRHGEGAVLGPRAGRLASQSYIPPRLVWQAQELAYRCTFSMLGILGPGAWRKSIFLGSQCRLPGAGQGARG